MIIYCEKGYYPDSHFTLYKKKKTWNYTSYFDDLNKLLIDHSNDQSVQHYFLLNEKRFAFFKFDIFHHAESTFTIHDLNAIIEDKMLDCQLHAHGTRMLFYTIDTILVDGVANKYILGKKGMLFFRLSLVFIDTPTIELFSKRWENIFKNNNIHIFPRSFYTQQFLKKQLEKQSYHMLDIQSDTSTIISIKNGFYDHIGTVNRGSSMLKNIYKENNISELLYKKRSEITSSFAEQTINHSVDFFTKMLSKRLHQHIGKEKDLILISDLTANEFFQDSFSKWYNEYINGYILPFHYSNMLNTFGKKRKSQDIHALALINYKEDHS